MAVLKLPSRSATSQPQGPYEVDYSNPITEGLLETVIPRTLVTARGKRVVVSGNSLLKVTPSVAGPVLSCTAFDNSGGSVIQFPGTSTWAPNPPFTAHTYFYQGIDSAIQNNVGMSFGSNNGGWLFLVISKQVQVTVTWSGGGAGVSATSAVIPLNTPILASIVVRVGTFDLYINGDLVVANVAHSCAGIPNAASMPFFDGNIRYGNLSGVYNLSVWKRCLRPEEIKSLSGNVWQLFKAPSKYIDIQPKQFFAPTQSKMLGTSIGQPATTVSTGRGTRGATRASQPQGPVGIDWSNPITRGLVFALNPISAFDLVKKLAVPGISPQIATSSGIYIGGVSSTQTSLGNGPVATSSTWTGLLDIDTRPNPNGWGGRFWRPTGNNDGQHTVQLGGTTGTKVVGVSINYAAIFNISLTDNSQSRCVIKHRAADHAIWVNGSLKGASSNAAAWSIGVNSSNVAGSDAIGLQLLWDRTLSDVEILSISLNPWQIFTPIQRNIWVPYP